MDRRDFSVGKLKGHSTFVKTLALLWTIVHKCLERCCGMYIKHFIPIKRHVILFKSIPDYTDNARALAEYMVEKGYNKFYKIYFDVENLSKYKDSVEGITFVSCKNKLNLYRLSKMRLMITAEYTMETHNNMLPTKYWKPGQIRVRLWHGCGYKDRNSIDKVKVRKFEAALVPGKLFVKPKAYYWNVDEKYILPIGYPRYKWLKERNRMAEKMIQSFQNDSNTKVVIWMPTFRNDKNGKLTDSASITQFPLVESPEQWIKIDKFCKEKNVTLLVKLHRLQPDYDIPFDRFESIKKIGNDTFENANVQMYQFLALTDGLISDYSSVAIDYLIVDKPIAFALQDYEVYKRTRGFVFDDPRNYMPGHHLYSFSDLKDFLFDISSNIDKYKDLRLKMYDEAITCSDDYCLDTLEAVGICQTNNAN